MSDIKPIKPEDVQKVKNAFIPKQVIKAFNQLIVKNWNGTSATVKQDDVLALIVDEESGRTRSYYFDNKFLDVGELYREQGWKVVYDKPAYCERYPAKFKFSLNE